MTQLLEAAGGLNAEDASGHFYVVRRSEKGPQTLIPRRRVNSGDSIDATISLRPHDVVVVETKGLVAGRPDVFSEYHDPASRMRGSQVRGRVQIALMNLIDRPVVVKLNPQEATLVDIIRGLNQTYDVRPGIRIVQPNVSSAVVHHARSGRKGLASGTVLIFDRSLIRRESLPRLPEAMPIERVAQRVNYVQEFDNQTESNVQPSVPDPTSDPLAEEQPLPDESVEKTPPAPDSLVASLDDEASLPTNPRARSNVPTKPMTVDTTAPLPPIEAEPTSWKDSFTPGRVGWVACVVALFVIVQIWKKASTPNRPTKRPMARRRPSRQRLAISTDSAQETEPDVAMPEVPVPEEQIAEAPVSEVSITEDPVPEEPVSKEPVSEKGVPEEVVLRKLEVEEPTAIEEPAPDVVRAQVGSRTIRIDAGHSMSHPHSNPESTSTGGQQIESPKAPPNITTEELTVSAIATETEVAPQLPRVSMIDDTQPLLDRVLAAVYEARRR